MVDRLLKRFLLLCAPAWLAGAIVLLAFSGGRASLAFTLSFLLVALDFAWMAKGLSHLLGSGEMPQGASRLFLVGLAFRSLLLLLGIYGIFWVLPKESLGVLLGIGGPLILLTIAGVTATRG